MANRYRKTMLACYLGFVTQAIAANFAPLLYLTFHRSFGISLGRLALLSSVFFVTQLVVDLLCARYADRIGYRRCVVGSQLFSALGLLGMAALPGLLPDPYLGILCSIVLYAIGSGLTEVLCSPIVVACPSDHKEAAMSLLHSFYCWGSVAVILLSTLFFAAFGMEGWRWLACLWALVPLYNIYNFATCPMVQPVEEGKGLSTLALFRRPLFWLAVMLMVCSGASELAMSQWASAFAESALGLSKTTGDIAGPCLFAVTMGLSRAIYGKYGGRIDLTRFMIGSGCLCLVCYLLASLASWPMAGLVGCILCGFSVGVMWPGTISLCAGNIPAGGTVMFALLAMAGDLGGALGPGLVGGITQSAGDDLRSGMLVGCVFPLLLVLALLALGYRRRRRVNS